MAFNIDDARSQTIQEPLSLKDDDRSMRIGFPDLAWALRYPKIAKAITCKYTAGYLGGPKV